MFLQKVAEYLGHRINEEGIHTSNQKVKAIVEAPSPRNLQELRSYLELLKEYVIPQLATTLHPLHK